MKSPSQSNSGGSNSTLQAGVNHLLAKGSRHSTRIPWAQNYINDVKKTKVEFIFCFGLPPLSSSQCKTFAIHS